MANGGIIGPVQEGAKCSTISAKVTSFTSSGTFTAQATASADAASSIIYFACDVVVVLV